MKHDAVLCPIKLFNPHQHGKWTLNDGRYIEHDAPIHLFTFISSIKLQRVLNLNVIKKRFLKWTKIYRNKENALNKKGKPNLLPV